MGEFPRVTIYLFEWEVGYRTSSTRNQDVDTPPWIVAS